MLVTFLTPHKKHNSTHNNIISKYVDDLENEILHLEPWIHFENFQGTPSQKSLHAISDI